MVVVFGLACAGQAQAVFTFLPTQTRRSITLQVGSSGGVDMVTFNVTGANIAPTPTAVTGTSNGPATTPTGGTQIVMTAQGPFGVTYNEVKLNVDSSAAMTCISGGCGTTTIPFTTISWTAYNHDATYPTLDIQSGTFNGSASQTLVDFYVIGGSIQMSNVLQFSYNNATLYPSGTYYGRVTYTASIP